MLKIEFPADNKALAAAIGHALLLYGAGQVDLIEGAPVHIPVAADTVAADTVDDGPAGSEPAADTVDDGKHADGPAAMGLKNEIANAGGKANVPTADEKPKDNNGVSFDPEFCGVATEPYYSTGKHSGQWKKKRGVTEEAYNAWYGEAARAAEQAKADPAADGEGDAVDAAAAFGGTGTVTDTPAPTDCGELMVWVAEQIAAEKFTQQDVTDAYRATGIEVKDIIPPNSDEDVATRVATIYAALNA